MFSSRSSSINNRNIKFVIFFENVIIYEAVKNNFVQVLGVKEDDSSHYNDLFKECNPIKVLTTDPERAGLNEESTKILIDRRESSRVTPLGKNAFRVTPEEIRFKKLISSVFGYENDDVMCHSTDFNITCVCVMVNLIETMDEKSLISLLIGNDTNIITFTVSSRNSPGLIEDVAIKINEHRAPNNKDQTRWYLEDLDYTSFQAPNRLVACCINLNYHTSLKYSKFFTSHFDTISFRILSLLDLKIANEYYYFLVKKIQPRNPEILSNELSKSGERWNEILSQVSVHA